MIASGGIGEELRGELRRCVNAAGLHALAEALLMGGEEVHPGGLEEGLYVGAEAALAADLAKDASEWLSLAGKVLCNGVVFSQEEDVECLDRDLCRALEEGLGMWEESWRGLFFLGLSHKEAGGGVRVDGRVFDEIERQIERGRDLLKRLEWPVADWDGGADERQECLTPEDVVYFAGDADRDWLLWDVAPDGSRVVRRWMGAVLTEEDAVC